MCIRKDTEAEFMKYYMPTKVYSEPDCIASHAEEIAGFGSHALIVTGRCSAKKNGALDDMTAALQNNGQQFTLFDEVEENPSVETVMKVRDTGLRCGADFVIGIGGGSPMDAAKAIALMINRPYSDWDALYTAGGSPALPVIAVPTTCGTGSEVTGVSVLTRHDLQTKVSIKHKIFPSLALIDGRYICNTPHKIIVNTAIDALSHLIESCVNTQSDCFSEMSSYAGLRLWGECRPYIEGTAPIDPEAAQNLMNASALAGMSIAQTGTAIPHALSYMLTYHAGIPHGAAVGAFQANYLDFAKHSLREKILQTAGFRNTNELRSFIHNLAPVQVDRALLESSADSVLQNPEKLRLCPYPIDKKIMQKLIAI